MPVEFESRLHSAYERAATRLLKERNPEGHWTGELSTSALSTATACLALHLYCVGVRKQRLDIALGEIDLLIENGLVWLVENQNEDGGWGDTTKSFSNISTSMLAHASLTAIDASRYESTISAAAKYIEQAGGTEAMIARYGKDQTFSVPILTHCALAGLVPWKKVPQLPFELACFPASFYKFLRMPVVSYALPALIAIGQVRFHKQTGWNPVTRIIRNLSISKSLRVLEKVQPPNGGFLEAAPLTSFVTMSLCGMGLVEHPVVVRAVQFLRDSVRSDGSFPIDTNLATWVTTLSVNGLSEGCSEDGLSETISVAEQKPIRDWLLNQQYREVHPFTNADPGGWAWTDLPGGVPDADDTPGAILALLNLLPSVKDVEERNVISESLAAAVGWLLDLQNGDGGIPTFCKGWGKLPFDRSACDLTAHTLSAFHAWRNSPYCKKNSCKKELLDRVERSFEKGFRYLVDQQKSDGSWLPLWFGNQHVGNEENRVFGTSRVLASFFDCDRGGNGSCKAGD